MGFHGETVSYEQATLNIDRARAIGAQLEELYPEDSDWRKLKQALLDFTAHRELPPHVATRQDLIITVAVMITNFESFDQEDLARELHTAVGLSQENQ